MRKTSPARHRIALAASVFALVCTPLTACGGESDGGDGGPVTIDIAISGGEVSPQGERVEVGVGETITFDITADQAGGLHLHSSPEHEFDYPAGESTHSVVIDNPGVVDVEDHDLGIVIVKLEVR